MKCLFVMGSITTAIAAKKYIAARLDAKASVSRAPAGLYDYGCNYSVSAACDDCERLLEKMLAEGMKCGAAYYVLDGEYIEFYRKEDKR